MWSIVVFKKDNSVAAVPIIGSRTANVRGPKTISKTKTNLLKSDHYQMP